MEEKLYKLTDLERDFGFKSATLRKRISRGELSTVVRLVENKPKNFLTEATLQMLLSERDKKSDNYQEMVDVYLSEMKSHVSELFHNRALSEKHVSEMERYLKLFWTKLGKEPNIQDFGAPALKEVLLSFVDENGKPEKFATRRNMYTACNGLMTLLVDKGYKTEVEHFALKRLRPAKHGRRLRPALTYAEILELMEANNRRKKGRRQYDIKSMTVYIALYALAGVRKMEAVNLTLDRINLDEGYMLVIGKNDKERVVPIFPKLHEILVDWIAYRNQYSFTEVEPGDFVVPQYKGMQHTESSIGDRFTRFSEVHKRQLSPHDLRRSCATIAAMHGMPTAAIKEMLGHTDEQVTQGYQLIDNSVMMNWVKNNKHLYNVPAPDASVSNENTLANDKPQEEPIEAVVEPPKVFPVSNYHPLI